MIVSLASVGCLHKISRPPAVVGGVGTIIVNAIKCHSRRSWRHIGIETGKIQPALTNRNATTAIIEESGIPWIPASIEHRRPYPIERMPRQAMCTVPVAASAFAARCAFPGTKIAAQNRCVDSTVAATAPIRAFVVVAEADDSPSSESLAGDINTPGHGGLLERLPGQVTGRRSRAVPLRILA
jgi:hypothetical protein